MKSGRGNDALNVKEDDNRDEAEVLEDRYVELNRLVFEAKRHSETTAIIRAFGRLFIFIVLFVMYAVISSDVYFRWQIDSAHRQFFESKVFPSLTPGDSESGSTDEIVVSSTRSSTNITTGDVSQDITFNDIRTMKQMWSFVNHVIWEFLLLKGSQKDWVYMGDNKLLYGLRFAQHRANSTMQTDKHCNRHPKIQRVNTLKQQCYNYDEKGPETKYGCCAVGPSCDVTQYNDPNYRCYEHTAKSNSNPVRSAIRADVLASNGLYNPNGGFLVDIPLDKGIALETLRAMQGRIASNGAVNPQIPQYVDEQTKAVLLSFSSYNNNINYFTQTAFLFERGKHGTFRTRMDFSSVRLLETEGRRWTENAALISGVLVALGGLAYLFGLLVGCLRGPHKWISFWNIIDLVSNALLLIHLNNIVQKYVIADGKGFFRRDNHGVNTAGPFTDQLKVLDLGRFYQSFLIANEVYAINVMLIIFRIFKFLIHLTDYRAMVETVFMSVNMCRVFMWVSATQLAMLAWAAHIVYGKDVAAFNQVGETFKSFLRLTCGNMSYEPLLMIQTSSQFTVVFLLVVFVCVILLFTFLLFGVIQSVWKQNMQILDRTYDRHENYSLIGFILAEYRGWRIQAKVRRTKRRLATKGKRLGQDDDSAEATQTLYQRAKTLIMGKRASDGKRFMNMELAASTLEQYAKTTLGKRPKSAGPVYLNLSQLKAALAGSKRHTATEELAIAIMRLAERSNTAKRPFLMTEDERDRDFDKALRTYDEEKKNRIIMTTEGVDTIQAFYEGERAMNPLHVLHHRSSELHSDCRYELELLTRETEKTLLKQTELGKSLRQMDEMVSQFHT